MTGGKLAQLCDWHKNLNISNNLIFNWQKFYKNKLQIEFFKQQQSLKKVSNKFKINKILAIVELNAICIKYEKISKLMAAKFSGS